MKTVLFVLTVAFPLISFGGTNVCSGPSIYLSEVHGDFGAVPPHGMVLGRDIIVHDGKVVLDRTHIQGLGLHGIAPYHLNFEGDETVLEQKGTAINGFIIFKQMGVLYKRNTTGPAEPTEVAREEVVCKRTWKMVP